MTMKKILCSGVALAPLLALGLVLPPTPATAQGPPASAYDRPILVIGFSNEQGAFPFNDDGVAPIFGITQNAGAYLALGDALIRNPGTAGYVINEAQPAATTFDRDWCFPACGVSGHIDGLDNQLTKALARVRLFDFADPFTTLGYNTDYVVVGGFGDCIFPVSLEAPVPETLPCTLTELDEAADRYAAIVQRVVDLGLTPIVVTMPPYDGMDLPMAAAMNGFPWVISEADYNYRKEATAQRLAQIPSGIVVDAWQGFEHLGDGVHPTDRTSQRAAQRVVRAIHRDQGPPVGVACQLRDTSPTVVVRGCDSGVPNRQLALGCLVQDWIAAECRVVSGITALYAGCIREALGELQGDDELFPESIDEIAECALRGARR